MFEPFLEEGLEGGLDDMFGDDGDDGDDGGSEDDGNGDGGSGSDDDSDYFGPGPEITPKPEVPSDIQQLELDFGEETITQTNPSFDNSADYAKWVSDQLEGYKPLMSADDLGNIANNSLSQPDLIPTGNNNTNNGAATQIYTQLATMQTKLESLDTVTKGWFNWSSSRFDQQEKYGQATLNEASVPIFIIFQSSLGSLSQIRKTKVLPAFEAVIKNPNNDTLEAAKTAYGDFVTNVSDLGTFLDNSGKTMLQDGLSSDDEAIKSAGLSASS